MRGLKCAIQAWSSIQGITRYWTISQTSATTSLDKPCFLKRVPVVLDTTKVRPNVSSRSISCCKSVVQAQRLCYPPFAHSKRNFGTHLDGLVWGPPRVWLPSKGLTEWALRPGHHIGVAILNAFQTAGGHVHRMLSIMLAEGFRVAACLAGPRLRCVAPLPTARPLLLSWLLSLAQAVADLTRLIQVVFLLTPVVCWAPLALQYGYCRHQWMHHFRHTLETLGPAFIKWGQWAATRRDVFPPDLCKELEWLHSHAPQHSLRFTHNAIRRAFADSPEDLFQQFEERPVASGSIAQVYKARLSQKGALHTGMDAGTEVAVKVRHPGVVKAIRRDFASMLRLARLASLLPCLRGLRLEETLAQFAAPLQEQVDLSLEAENLLQFNLNFKKHAAVRFPVPIYPLVAPEVSVETFQEGGKPPEDWMQPRIVLLDVGMVTRLSTADQQNMVKLFQSLLGMDGQGIANAVLSFSGEKQTCTDPCAFAASLTAHLDTMNAARWSDTQYGSASEALFAVRQHEVSLPGHICGVVVTTLVLEGWSSKLDPDQSLLNDIAHALHASKLSLWRQQLAHVFP
ncbi:hypothetical protein ABBQ32_003998 [Trebouxia sp. C0010 RCD-2024]